MGFENFGKYLFGWLHLRRDFLVFWYSKLMFLFFVLYHLMLSGNFYGSEIRNWDFWGVKSGRGDIWGFCLKPKGFFGVLIFAPNQSSLSLEIRRFAVEGENFISKLLFKLCYFY